MTDQPRRKKFPLQRCISAWLVMLQIQICLYFLYPHINTWAESLYSDCKFGDDTQKNVPIYTPLLGVNYECATSCTNLCGTAFGILTGPASEAGSNVPPDFMSGGVKTENADMILQWNRDNVTNCINTCLKGVAYNGSIREYPEDDDGKNINPFKSGTSISAAGKCNSYSPDEMKFFIESSESSGKNDTITLFSRDPGTHQDILGDNIIGTYYARGRRSLMLFPDGAGWKELSVNNGWSGTGIFVQNGDELSISYWGRYYGTTPLSSCNGTKHDCNTPDAHPERYDLEIKIGDKTAILKGHAMDLDIFLNPVDPDQDENVFDKDSKDADVVPPPTNPENSPVFGLEGSVGPASIPKYYLRDDTFTNANNSCITKGKNGTKYNFCYNDNAFPQFDFSGVVSGLTKSQGPQELMIRYSKGREKYYPSNTRGSFYVSIDWKGVSSTPNETDIIMFKGSSMTPTKVKMVKDGSNPLNPQNTQLDPNPRELTDASKYALSMTPRLSYKSESNLTTSSVTVQNYEYTPSFGGYNIEVHRRSEVTDSLVCNIISRIRGELYGTSRQPGVAPTGGIVFGIYQTLLLNKTFVNIVRAFLVLYITYVSLCFAIGLKPMNQKEFLGFVIRTGVIATLLGSDSWSIIYKYLFATFIDGVEILMDKFSYSIFPGKMADLQRCAGGGPLMVTQIGSIWSDVFSDAIMAKLISLFWFGIKGSFTFLVIVAMMVIGCAIFCIVAIKILIIYLMAAIAMGMMLAMAPIMIPFFLFGYTRTIFDSWLKEMVVLLLQPVVVSVSFMIFRDLFMILLETFTSFSICKTCVISIPFLDFCIYKDWMPIRPSHFANSSTAATTIAFISLMLVAQGAHNFVALSSAMVGRLVSFTSVTVGSQMRSMLSPVTSAASSGASMITTPVAAALGLRKSDVARVIEDSGKDGDDGKNSQKPRK